MKRTLKSGVVRYKPRAHKPRTRYKSKAYRLLEEQLYVIRMGSLGSLFADMLVDTAERPGFTRRFLDPVGARQISAEADQRKREREAQRKLKEEQRNIVYKQYFVPYHRNKLSYPLVPDEVMCSLGFRNIQDHGSDFANTFFKKGWQ